MSAAEVELIEEPIDAIEERAVAEAETATGAEAIRAEATPSEPAAQATAESASTEATPEAKFEEAPRSAHPALPPPPPIPSTVGLKAAPAAPGSGPKVVPPPRNFTTTAQDWPIAQVPSAATLLLPEFGDRPDGAPDPTRFSLPAFLPPPGMILEPSNTNAIVSPSSTPPALPELSPEEALATQPEPGPIETGEPATLEPVSVAPVSIAPTSAAEPALAFSASITPGEASQGPTPELALAPQVDVAAQMDAAFAEVDDLELPRMRPGIVELAGRLPRWACFAAGLALGVVVTLVAS